MNLIRLIKIKKLNGELDNLTDKEKLFISLFDKLFTIDGIYYKDGNKKVFWLDTKHKILYYSYDYVYLKFNSTYYIDTFRMNKLIGDILVKRLKMYKFKSDWCYIY